MSVKAVDEVPSSGWRGLSLLHAWPRSAGEWEPQFSWNLEAAVAPGFV